MVQIALNDEQARQLRQAAGAVQFCDPEGNVVARVELPISREEVERLKRLAREPGPRYSGAQVRARLQALQAEWDRTGGFDQAYMREYLRKLDEADPGHYRDMGQSE